jgi:hypothetical protein
MVEERNESDNIDEPSKIFEWEPSPNGNPEIYANFTHISWSLVDVRIQFGQLIPDAPTSKRFVSQERGAVTIAWQRAKLLAKTLTNLVEAYEEVNGDIKPLKLAEPKES